MIYGSVCSGIEAASVAWHPLGWQPAFLSEIDKFPRAVLRHHFPEVPLHGDFTTIQAGDFATIDLLVGGTPCQDFSVAGLRAGLAGERGNLTLEYLRLAGRLRPRWLVWENVPGVLSSDGGRALGAFLGGLAELGYGFAWRVLDAQYVRVDGFGRAVPQRRRRVFVVGYLGDWRRAAAVLFERESLCGNPPPRREAGQNVAPTISARVEGGGGLGTDFDFDCDGGLVASTLDASFGRLQGCSGQDANHGHSHLVAFGGNNTSGAIEVATAVNAHGVPHGRLDFESETLIAFDTTQITHPENRSNPRGDTAALAAGAHPPAIAFGTKEFAQDAGDVSPPLRAMGSNKNHPNGGGQVGVAYNLTPSQSNKDYKAREARYAQAATTGGNRPSARGGDVIAIQGAATRENPASGPDGVGVRDDGAAYTLEALALARGEATHWAVRRLTPRECERLQGFPDDFTLIPVGKKLAADGPRYKALGNSMAVNVMRWIGQRIDRVEAMHNQFGAAA